MEVKFNYSKIQDSPSLEEMTEKKLNHLDKFFHDSSKAEVTFRADGKSHTMKVQVQGNGKEFAASSTTNDMYKNIDVCMNKLQEQVKKAKKDYRSDSHKMVAQARLHEQGERPADDEGENSGEQ